MTIIIQYEPHNIKFYGCKIHLKFINCFIIVAEVFYILFSIYVVEKKKN